MTLRVGVVTYLKARGLGYDAAALRFAFAGMEDVEPSFFPVDDIYRVDRRMRKRRVRPAPVRGEWDWPEAERGRDLATWVAGLDTVITLEVFLREVASVAFGAGVRLVHVPNLEWISDRPGWWTDLRAADTIVAKTRHTVRALEGAGLPNVTFVPWSIPLPIEAPRPTEPPVSFFHSAGFGGAHDPKNPEAVLAAFTDALGGSDAARLVFKTQLPAKARKTPLDLAPYGSVPNLEIIQADLPYAEMLALSRAADVAVYPSRAEGFGLPLLESLTLGVPVITTDAPPMNELITHDVNGRLVPGERKDRHRHVPLFEVDREALAAAMVRLTDPAETDRLKAGAATGLEDRRREFRDGLRRILTAPAAG